MGLVLGKTKRAATYRVPIKLKVLKSCKAKFYWCWLCYGFKCNLKELTTMSVFNARETWSCTCPVVRYTLRVTQWCEDFPSCSVVHATRFFQPFSPPSSPYGSFSTDIFQYDRCLCVSFNTFRFVWRLVDPKKSTLKPMQPYHGMLLMSLCTNGRWDVLETLDR